MKRRNYYTAMMPGMMVSRTTFRAFLVICLVYVCIGGSHGAKVESDSESINTTPMSPSRKNDSSDSISRNFKYNQINNDTITKKSTLSTGNELWDGIIRDCYKQPTFSCFQKNVFGYLDQNLDVSDVNITSRLSFLRNKVDYEKYTREANENHENDEMDNEIPDEARSESPLEEVTDALYGKSVKFMMTHDVEIKMPEMMFDGATFRISPRSIEGNGAIVKLELIPKSEIEVRDTGRIFKKKIFKFFKNKLLLSFLALILIIKLIKIKLFWLLPIIVGVTTAKKLLLKLLLFFFPALGHIFKLCSYYHTNYHQTKYHHHHHSINHHHTVLPGWYADPDHQSSVALPNGPELIFTHPPKGHPAEYLHGVPPNPPHPHAHHQPDWEFSGPGLGSEYISDVHRNALVDGVSGGFKPKLDDANDIHAWGLGTTPDQNPSQSYHVNPFIQQDPNRVVNPKIRPQGPVYVPQQQKHPPPQPAAAHIAAQYDPAFNQQNQHQHSPKDIQQAQAHVREALRIQAEQKLISQQQKILQQQPFVQDAQPITPKGYDPFFSPILAKMDKIFLQLGFNDDNCKERLVCSMYKNPGRYSPHSNFISAELSRDTSELQKAPPTNPAAIRFYKMVQAARDGQDQRDCLRIYAHCSINTE